MCYILVNDWRMTSECAPEQQVVYCITGAAILDGDRKAEADVMLCRLLICIICLLRQEAHQIKDAPQVRPLCHLWLDLCN